MKYHNLLMRSIVKNANIVAEMQHNQPEMPVPNEALGFSHIFIDGPEDFEYETTNIQTLDRELRECYTRMDHFELQLLRSIHMSILKKRNVLQEKAHLENLSRAEKEELLRLHQEKTDRELAEALQAKFNQESRDMEHNYPGTPTPGGT